MAPNEQTMHQLNDRYVLGTVLERLLTNDPDARFVGDTLTLEGAAWLDDAERIVVQRFLSRPT